MSLMTCAQAQEAAPELALGVLGGAERADQRDRAAHGGRDHVAHGRERLARQIERVGAEVLERGGHARRHRDAVLLEPGPRVLDQPPERQRSRAHQLE